MFSTFDVVGWILWPLTWPFVCMFQNEVGHQSESKAYIASDEDAQVAGKLSHLYLDLPDLQAFPVVPGFGFGSAGTDRFEADIVSWVKEAKAWFSSFPQYPEEDWYKFTEEMARWWPTAVGESYLTGEMYQDIVKQLMGVLYVLLACVKGNQDVNLLLDNFYLGCIMHDIRQKVLFRDMSAVVIQRVWMDARMSPYHRWGRNLIHGLYSASHEDVMLP